MVGKTDASTAIQTMSFDSFSEIPVPHEISNAVNLEGVDFNSAMMQQPAMFAYYGALFAAASYSYEESRSELKKIEADVAAEIRKRYQNMAQKLTEKQLQMEVDMDIRTQSKRADVRRKRYQRDLCQVAVESMEHRLQALISIGAKERAELRGIDPMIRTPHGYGAHGHDSDHAISEQIRAKRQLLSDQKLSKDKDDVAYKNSPDTESK